MGEYILKVTMIYPHKTFPIITLLQWEICPKVQRGGVPSFGHTDWQLIEEHHQSLVIDRLHQNLVHHDHFPLLVDCADIKVSTFSKSNLLICENNQK
jgi:hypothetical protein